MHTAATDTLTCNTALLDRWLADPDYAYARGLMTADEGLLARLRRWLIDCLADWFDWAITDAQLNWVFVAVVVVCVLLLAWFVWRRHPGLFRSVGRNSTPVSADEDTIYGIDFATETERAAARGDYYTAVRYTYLHALKRLDDDMRISWQPYKAPNEYIYELKDADTAAFRQLTNAFLQVRYGNRTPDHTLYEETTRLAEAVCTPRKGGEA